MSSIRPDAVAWLADAYRHRASSALARLVVANRHREYTIPECLAALGQVIAETEAALVVAESRRELGLPLDPVDARLTALLQCTDQELTELHVAGLLDDLELDE